MKTFPISDLDVIFISYDEPNADENWEDLLTKCPWAKRSHGIYGSDAAHKAAANLSNTNRFIGIDADNIVDPSFFEQVITPFGFNDVISWAAQNEINGLIYGNGGVKCWPCHVALNMQTHEIANDDLYQVDFCWDNNYIQKNKQYSITYSNASPYQAFRAGFREGCKMSLNRGNRVSDFKQLHPANYTRLLIWMSVGMDVENGVWAMYGARKGFLMTNSSGWDWHNVRDFKWHDEFWREEIAPQFDGDDVLCPRTGYDWDEMKLYFAIQQCGEDIYRNFGLTIAELNNRQSKFFKEVYINSNRI